MSTAFPDSTRLHYRRLTFGDAAFLVALVNSPDWLAYIGDRGVRTVAEAHAYLQDKLFAAMSAPEFGPYAMCLREGDRPIGTIGIYDRPGLDVPDLGFALLPAYIGQGYGEESARAALSFAERHQITELSAISDPRNAASAGLLKKLGFRQNGSVVLPGQTLELVKWAWNSPSADLD